MSQVEQSPASAKAKKTPMTIPEYREAFERTLERVHHEDTLIDRRFSWLLTSQSILIAAHAIASALGTKTEASVLQFIIPLALGACLLTYASLLAAVFAIYAFCKQLDVECKDIEECETEYNCPLFSKQNILGPTITHLVGQSSAFLLPIGIISIWVFLLTDRLLWPILVTVILLVIVILLWQWRYPYKSRLKIGLFAKQKH